MTAMQVWRQAQTQTQKSELWLAGVAVAEVRVAALLRTLQPRQTRVVLIRSGDQVVLFDCAAVRGSAVLDR